MFLYVNGKRVETTAHTLWEVRDKYPETDVSIYNGFQTSENLQLSEGDQIVLIKKGTMPKESELEAMMCARHTPGVHEKVKKARVAVAGLGGLGSHIAIFLARTGVGTLHLVDYDIVEPSNLNRQMYEVSHLGKYKTEALLQEIQCINPYIKVRIDTVKVTEKNATELFAEDDYVCEAFDGATQKAMLVNTLLETNKNVKIVSGSGMAGFETANTIQTRKISRRFYVCGDGETEACPGMGLMAPRVAVCAGHEANMVLRLIIGEQEA